MGSRITHSEIIKVPRKTVLSLLRVVNKNERMDLFSNLEKKARISNEFYNQSMVADLFKDHLLDYFKKNLDVVRRVEPLTRDEEILIAARAQKWKKPGFED